MIRLVKTTHEAFEAANGFDPLKGVDLNRYSLYSRVGPNFQFEIREQRGRDKGLSALIWDSLPPEVHGWCLAGTVLGPGLDAWVVVTTGEAEMWVAPLTVEMVSTRLLSLAEQVVVLRHHIESCLGRELAAGEKGMVRWLANTDQATALSAIFEEIARKN